MAAFEAEVFDPAAWRPAYPNPAFDQAAADRWDPERYYTDPDYYLDKDLVRPYRVGMSCGFCHVGRLQQRWSRFDCKKNGPSKTANSKRSQT